MSNRHLSNMTWEDVFSEMSIAGNPHKITQLGRDIMVAIGNVIDPTNRAELYNIEFMLKRVTAEIRAAQRKYDREHRLTDEL